MHKGEHKCDHNFLRVKEKKKGDFLHRWATNFYKWMCIDGLCFFERRRLIAWSVAKKIKNIDDNWELISLLAHELNSDLNL